MDKLSLPESIDRKAATDTLIKENQTLRKKIFEKLNEEIKQQNLHTDKTKEEKVLRILRRSFPVGFSDTKSIKTIINKLDLPEGINRESITEALITRNRQFLAAHELSPMRHSLCTKQTLDNKFQQLSLQVPLEKKLRNWITPKVLDQHRLYVEEHQKNFKEQIMKENIKRLEKETQRYIENLKNIPNDIEFYSEKETQTCTQNPRKRPNETEFYSEEGTQTYIQNPRKRPNIEFYSEKGTETYTQNPRKRPNEIETYPEKDPSAKQQVQNPFHNSKRLRKDDYQR